MTTWQPVLRSSVQQEVEWRRCADDPIHFLSTWWCVPVVTNKPGQRGGLQQFELFDYQREVLQLLRDGCKKLLVLKGRQIGFTTLIAGYMAWMAMFRDFSQILMVSRRQDDARRVTTFVRTGGIQYLPSWMKKRCSLDNRKKEELVFSNGSSIIAMPTAGDPGRGYTASLVVLDEWAFYKDPETAWRSVQPAAELGGSVIAMSTANGTGTPFHKQWELAQTGTNGFTPLFYGWDSRPERDDAWYERTRAENTAAHMAQEYPTTPEEAFVASGTPVFRLDLVEKQGPLQLGRKGWVDDAYKFVTAVNPALEDDRLEVWAPPQPNELYSIGVDPSGAGPRGDYTSMHVVTSRGQVVAHWHGHIKSSVELAPAVRNLAEYYNQAYVIVEANAGYGAPLNDQLEADGYAHLYYGARRGLGGGVRHVPGFATTAQSKLQLIHELNIALEDGRLYMPCEATKKELQQFQLKSNGVMSAPPGGHDDRVMSLALAIHLANWLGEPPTSESIAYVPTYRVSEMLRRGRYVDGPLSQYKSGPAVRTLVQRYTDFQGEV